jgi:hypothetical protein
MAYEGEGDDRRAVPVVMPDVYGPPDDAPAERSEAGAIRTILHFLDSLPPDKAAIRIRVLLRRTRFDTGSLRESARKAGCPLTTFLREHRRMVEHPLQR